MLIKPPRISRGLRPTGLLNRSSPQARGLWSWVPILDVAAVPLRYRNGAVVGSLATDTINGAAANVTWVTDPLLRRGLHSDQSGGFGGSAQYAGAFSLLPGSTNICSISAWVKPDSIAGFTGFVSSNSAGAGFSMLVSGAGGNPLGYVWPNDGSDYSAASGLTLNTTHWNLCVVTISPTAAVLYVGNEVTGFRSYTNTTTHAAQDFTNATWWIGNDRDSGSYLNGSIADVRAYTRTLSPADVWALYDPATRWDLYAVPSSRVFFGGVGGAPPPGPIGLLYQRNQSVNRAATY